LTSGKLGTAKLVVNCAIPFVSGTIVPARSSIRNNTFPVIAGPPLWLLVTWAVNVTFVETGTAGLEEVRTVLVAYPTSAGMADDVDLT
jgi:hypothetical protein